MDLVKARKKAKEAGKDEGKPEVGQPASGVVAPSVPTAPAQTPAAPAAPEAKAQALPETEPAPAPKPKPKSAKKEKTAPPPPEPKPAPAPAEEKPDSDDIFMDSAFGEDLPPVEDFDFEDDSMVIAPAPVRSAAPPATQASGKKGAEPAEETDAAWEAEFDRMQRAHEAEEKEERERKQEPPSRPAAAKPAAKPKPAKPASPPPEKKKPILPLKMEEDWMVAERRESPTVGKVAVEWEDAAAAPLFPGKIDDDDFFSLVTEELYMHEFNRAAETDIGAQLELLSFRLGQETYAVRLTSIRQIIKLVPITMVPRAPEYVIGILSLRGTIIPVFDLRRRLKLGVTEPTRKSRIIVVAEGRYIIGMIVDEVLQVVRLSETSLEPPPSMFATVESEYIESIGRTQNRMLILLSLEKIMLPVNGGNR